MDHGLYWCEGDNVPVDIALEITRELNNSPSDRAAAVLASSLIEQRLKEVLRNWLIDNKEAQRELFRDGAPLTTIGVLAHLDICWDGLEIARTPISKQS